LANTNSNIIDAAGTGLAGASSAIGWAATSAGYVLGVDNTVGNGILVKTTAVGTGSYIAKFESGGSNRVSIRADGNVGIGTTTPTARLSVVGTHGSQMYVGTADGFGYKIGRNTSDGFLEFQGNQVGATGYNFQSSAGGSSLIILNNGNVGIGAVPSASLEVKPSALGTQTSMILRSARNQGDAATNQTILMVNPFNSNAQLGFIDYLGRYGINPGLNSSLNQGIIDTSLLLGTRIAGAKGIIVRGVTSQTASLYEAQNDTGTPIFSVGSGGGGYFAGNVGIGTTNSSSLLTVAGSGATPGAILISQIGSQSANPFEIRNSSNSLVANFDSSGSIYSSYFNSTFGMNITSGDITVSGKIGIGTTTPSYPLHVVAAGSDVARFNGTGSTQCTVVAGTGWSCSSDINLKKDIEALSSFSTLDQLLELNPVSYRWKDGNNDQILQHGFIAQDVEGIFPELVTTDSASGLKSLSMGGMIPYIVSAIQEMAHKIANISKWFGSNGDKFKVEGEVCVDDVCVTKEQFKALLQNGNTGGGSSGGGGSSTPEPEPVVTEPEPTPTEPEPEPTPTPTPEEGAGSGGGGSEVPPVEESAPEPASVVE